MYPPLDVHTPSEESPYRVGLRIPELEKPNAETQRYLEGHHQEKSRECECTLVEHSMGEDEEGFCDLSAFVYLIHCS